MKRSQYDKIFAIFEMILQHSKIMSRDWFLKSICEFFNERSELKSTQRYLKKVNFLTQYRRKSRLFSNEYGNFNFYIPDEPPPPMAYRLV